MCDSRFIVSDYYLYACGGHLTRGTTVCTNTHRVSRKLVEERCLAALRNDLMTPEAMTLFVKETTRLLAAHTREQQPEVARLRRQLATVEAEIANILKAIRQGITTLSTKQELELAEAERTQLQAAITSRTTKADQVATLLPRATERYHALVNNLGGLSQRHMTQAREQIRELVGEIRLVPTKDGSLEAVLTGRYAGVLKLVGLNNMVAGEGFEPS
ncbi:MAG: hypothetical protein ACREJN_12485, partial [Nitrospiraceae bacterium]